MKNKAAWLSLFASSSTLVCCVLPSLLVVLGMGATMAGLVSNFPQLIWLSQYKAYVFSFSGVLISLAAIMHYKARNEPCPIDPELAKTCKATRKWSFVILAISGGLWLTGAFFAFVAVRIF